MPPPLQVDNTFAFIRQVAPVPACWLFKSSATIGGDTMQLLGQQFPLTHIPMHAFASAPPSVLWELHGAIDFNGKFMRSSSEFSEGSFILKITAI